MRLSNQLKKDEKSPLKRWIIYVFVLAAVIIVVFELFLQNNIYQVRDQNRIYISNTAQQTANRIDDILADTESSVATIARLYSDTMESSEPDPDILQDIAQDSTCDYVEYADSTGFNPISGIDVSDREYFQKGIAGETGVDVTYHSLLSDSTLVVFYAPLVYENETVGVLLATYHEDTMSEILEENYFGESSVSYLCESDGTVIAHSSTAGDVENILDFFTEDRLSGKNRETFLSALENHTSCVFSANGTDGKTDACLTQLDGTDWCIVQSYPSSVTAARINNINRVAAGTIILLALAFGGYVLLIARVEHKRRKHLIQEKQEMESVVNGVNRLFARFVIVNLEEDSYFYLKDYSNSPSTLERQGSYREFVIYFQEKIIETTGDIRLQDVLEADYLRTHLDCDTPYLRFHFCLQRKTGIHWENAAFVCLSRDADGAPVKVLFAIQDITELHELDERKNQALQDAFDAAEAANHAKDDFLSRMSHDMRTPMNAIMGMAAIASMHADDPERVKDCLNKLQLSGQHLLSLINEMLDLSKIESGRIYFHDQPFSVEQSVRQVLDYLQPEIAKKNLQMVFPGNRIQHTNVSGDMHLFQRILTCVLENAVEYTPDGGTITLSMFEETSTASSTSCYSFVCEDTGVGISKELLERIFEPFVSAQDSRLRQGQGIGLGLTIAKQFAQLMGGDILAESTPGKGSRFTVKVLLKVLSEDNAAKTDSTPTKPETATAVVTNTTGTTQTDFEHDTTHMNPNKADSDTLDTQKTNADSRESKTTASLMKQEVDCPLQNPEPDASFAASEPVASQETPVDSRRILLVEDNELNAEIAAELLGMLGAKTDIAENGQIAVELLLNTEICPYDLILMDIQMPVMNGYEATKRIRSSGRADLAEVPIVALSANTFRDDIDRSLASGMNAHLAKPVSYDDLAKLLQEWHIPARQ